MLAWLAYLFGRKREADSRIIHAVDSFRSIIAAEFAELDSKRWSESEFFMRSLPIITKAVYSFLPFVSDKSRLALGTILAEYQAHHEREFAPGYARLLAAIKEEVGDGGIHHFKLLNNYLKRFDDIAKEA